MNALFHAAEHLAAVDGYGAISVDALIGKRILIVHSGGASGDIPYQALCGEVYFIIIYNNNLTRAGHRYPL